MNEVLNAVYMYVVVLGQGKFPIDRPRVIDNELVLQGQPVNLPDRCLVPRSCNLSLSWTKQV